MHPEDKEAEREYVVAQALANVRARGFAPGPEVVALYARYGRGELSRAEVQAEMSRRSERLRASVGADRMSRPSKAFLESEESTGECGSQPEPDGPLPRPRKEEPIVTAQDWAKQEKRSN